MPEHTITAQLTDGPLKGRRMQVGAVQGRPPVTLDVPGPDDGTCRYCLDALVQDGQSAIYAFLYKV